MGGTHTDAGIASVSPAIGRGHSVADRRKLIMAVMLSTTRSSSDRNVDFKAANDHLNPFPESSPVTSVLQVLGVLVHLPTADHCLCDGLENGCTCGCERSTGDGVSDKQMWTVAAVM